MPSNDVTAIAIDSNNNKWIGTDRGGLARFDGTNWTIYNGFNSGLPNTGPNKIVNSIHSIVIDSKGNLWIGTILGGLVKYDGINWTVYNETNSGLTTNVVWPIAIDKPAGAKLQLRADY